MVELGRRELERKRPRLESPTGNGEHSDIKAPIIPDHFQDEDESHFLLSRDISSTNPSAASDGKKEADEAPPNGELSNGSHSKEEGTLVVKSPDRPKLIMSIKKSDLNLST